MKTVKSINYRISQLFEIVLLGGLLIMPFVWDQWANIPYELPRVWFVQRWVELLGVLTIVRVLVTKNFEIKINGRLVLLLVGFFVTVMVSSLLGVNFEKSLVGNYWRGDGITTLSRLMGLAIVVGLWWNKRLAEKVVYVNALSVGIFGIMAGYHLVVNGLFSTGFSFGQPNYFAGWILVAGVWSLEKISNKLLRYGLYLSMTLGLVASGSWIGIPVFVLYLLARYPKIRVLGFVGLILFGIWWWKEKENFSWLGPNGVVYESRERIFRKVWGGYVQRPLLGYGWANVDYAFNSFDWPFRVEKDVYLDKAHSSLLEVLVTTGVVGLVTYLLILGYSVKILNIQGLGLVMLFFVVHSQTNIVGIAEEVLFWVLVGSALGNNTD